MQLKQRLLVLNITYNQENENQNHNETPPQTSKIAHIKKWAITSADKDVKKKKHFSTVGRNVNCCQLLTHYGKLCEEFKNY